MMQNQTTIDSRSQVVLDLINWLREQNYHFITVTPLTHARIWQRHPEQLGQTLNDIFGWNRPFMFSKQALLPDALAERLLEAGWLIADESNADQVRSQIRISSLPLLGKEALLAHGQYPTVQAQSVFFGPDSYRFVLALQHFLQQNKPAIQRALELCAGAAPAALQIKQYAPDAEVFATDINDHAMQLAQVNGLTNQLPLEVRYSNLLNDLEGDFDLIVANPPYLADPQKRAYRHGGDLYGAALSLRIVDESLPRLTAQGTFMLYTGVAIREGVDLFWQALQPILQKHPHDRYRVTYTQLDPDVFGEELESGIYQDIDRIAAVSLIIRRQD